MKADPQLPVSDSARGACTTKEELAAGVVKARQETLWLQTRRHSSGPGPGEEDSLCFVALISAAARIKLESTWEDAAGVGVEGEWVQRDVVFVKLVKVFGKESSVSQWLWRSFQPVLWTCQQCCSLFHSVWFEIIFQPGCMTTITVN